MKFFVLAPCAFHPKKVYKKGGYPILESEYITNFFKNLQRVLVLSLVFINRHWKKLLAVGLEPELWFNEKNDSY